MFTSFNLFGQVKEHEIKLRDKKGNPSLIGFKETKVANQTQSVRSFLKKQFKADEKSEFRTSGNLVGIKKTNAQSQNFHQYYNGIKVEHGRLNAISKNGNLTKIVGRYVDIKNLTTTPNLSEQQALNAALQYLSAKKYAWEDESFEQFLKNEQNNPNATFFPKGELVIVEKNPRTNNPIPRLAYKFNIYALDPISRAHYYVDAENGEILMVDAILKHIDGTAQTRYSGTRTIETELFNGQYRLNDVTRGKGIHTYNLNGSFSYSSAVDFIDNDNNWTSSEYDNAAKDNAALDLHWGVIKTYDYFFQKHSRNSMDGDSIQIKAYAHYGINFDNAQWDESQLAIRFGDGGTNFDALTSIDVVAHEFGHGIDHFTSKLVYQDESGAIDESLSDIWGSLVEDFALGSSSNNWLIGEQITLNSLALRSMSNPKSLGSPDTYQGDNWWTSSGDNGGVHTNSGVMNHWFYLLAEGSSLTDGINDNNDAFNITGIGKEKAAQIVYYAQTELFMNSLLNYAEASTLTIQAAEDLFGAGSLEALSACQSWFAVGVGDGNCAVEFNIAGNSLVCSSNTYTVTGLPPGASVSWSVTPNLQIVNSTSNSVTVSTSSNGQSGTIFLNVNGSVSERNVWLGRPATPSKIFGPALVNTGAIARYSTGGASGASFYEWRLPYPYNSVTTFDYYDENWELLLPANDIQITAFTGYAKTSGYVQVWGKNSCGNGGARLLSVAHGSPGGPGGGGIPFNGFSGDGSNTGFNIYPNPAIDQLHIVFADNAIRKINLFNFQGVLIKNLTTKSNSLNIEVSTLPNGIYLLEIHQAGEKITEKIIVQH
ncbi:MAG: M4 family metallopeptidase [Flavobacteriaceae bacterium]|nr:M4 family metallopeptidase [Flavobacteriaceae bacterium]